jgi:hypothetical protein
MKWYCKKNVTLSFKLRENVISGVHILQFTKRYTCLSVPVNRILLVYRTLAIRIPITCVNNMQTPKVKFLGVLLDPNLNFRSHINSISSKISNSLYHLRAAKNILSQTALTTLYYSLVHSHHRWASLTRNLTS